MADDTRDEDSNSTTYPTAGAVLGGKQKLPKGWVLGPDGKPCRSCMSGAAFKEWTSQAKKTTKGTTTTTTHPHEEIGLPNDCPPDVEQLGRSSWTLLHSITASYPVSPTPTEQNNVKQFMGLFGKLYPCWVCAEDFQAFMVKNQVRTESRDEFGRWMCEAHNEVNRKLGKNQFDCNKWEERWRTGWKDGRCD
ncbi:ERV/ALR sulfhydryl oxidase domain-containing protein [Tricladium varicosporioides]|nr:ERV/ALR sulfhydryl oxidase domain-containing protein [Hymenoscyphus varicosporioides]